MNSTPAPQGSLLLNIARQAMTKYGLAPDFGDAALKQLASITGPAQDSSPDIRDLRHLLWASIDNDNSRDLDQLSVADSGSPGATRILVAIADVDAVVKPGSPIDGHARINTTSVYTPAAIFSMLPERLSTDLTSLGEGQERLAFIIDMAITDAGVVVQSDLYRAKVVNRAKLAYNAVGAWLAGSGPPPAGVAAVAGMEQQLRTQDKVAQSLRAVRRARGALDLQTIEAQPVFSEGVLSDLRPDEPNRAKQLIEEFMVAANGVTAQFLTARGFSALRRVLRDPERWPRIVALAAALGEKLPAEPSAPALNAFLVKRRQSAPELYPDLSLSVIKLLGSGEYVLDKPGQPIEGHFGLAVMDYTHSTAPNRRFPDLLTQRLLKAALTKQASPYSDAELQDLAAHCTLQEHNAAKVERAVNKSAAASLLAARIGAKFDAIVTGASDKGTWVRIDSPTTEGKVIKGFEHLDVGDHVRVVLLHTDVAHGFIDFARTK
ncbi:MAG TPA: RNB domain-containing ribonuclease [Steroidobacteraceae bacterium]|jgi:exoribonuclease-2|nr:RNB domain-containing ribonuclease [Steroidobacteraceae bacterium]